MSSMNGPMKEDAPLPERTEDPGAPAGQQREEVRRQTEISLKLAQAEAWKRSSFASLLGKK